jgi:hypothetical protein
MPGRRKLAFASLAEVVVDAEHLLAAGYEKSGNWDLAQVCGHLAEWMRFPMDGFPWAPLGFRVVFWVMRHTIARRELRKMLATGHMPSGPTLRETVPAPGGDPAAAVAGLRDTVGRVKAFSGELKPSPFFGAFTRDEWIGLNLVHAAHHLSFLVPKS